MKKILTVAGSKSSGGAGIQADLKTITLLGEYGLSVVTPDRSKHSGGFRNPSGATRFYFLPVGRSGFGYQLRCS